MTYYLLILAYRLDQVSNVAFLSRKLPAGKQVYAASLCLRNEALALRKGFEAPA